MSYSAFPGASGNSAFVAGHLAIQTGNGWRNEEITPTSALYNAPRTAGYKVNYFFSPDLSESVLWLPRNLLTPEATPGIYNLYRRAADGSYTWVNSATPKTPPSSLCPVPFPEAACFGLADVSAYAGASNDLSHIAFESTAELTPEAPGTAASFGEVLYEKSDGKVQLVGILPNGSPAPSSTAGAGSNVQYSDGDVEIDKRVEHAVSENGSRIVFEAPAAGEPDEEQNGLSEVYDRIEGKETVELSAPAIGATPAVTTAEPAQFWTASSDGSRVFFTSTAELTTASNTGSSNNGSDLYEYNFDAKNPSERLTDLTVDTNPTDASTGARVLGVVGASGDGAYVYFVAEGQLDGQGEENLPNMYLVHNGGKPIYIATLSQEDNGDWTELPALLSAYITPDGLHAAFTSLNSLTGYNNLDQETGLPDREVFEYNADTGKLLCGSCAQDGTHPVGDAEVGVRAASNASVNTPFYHIRILSNNGKRMVFTSPSRLATSDQKTGPASAVAKVYEYEANGESGCNESAGCTYMLSDPSNSERDVLLDMSADGSDIFFATMSHMVPSDTDNLADIYDARVDGTTVTAPQEDTCQGSCSRSVAGLSGAPMLVSGLVGKTGNIVTQAPAVPVHAVKCAKGKRLSRGRCIKAKAKARHRARKSIKTREGRR